MEQKCEHYMDEFLMLDKGQKLPFDLTLHILFCSKCRSEIRALSKAEEAAGRPLQIPVPVTDDSITLVMRKIDPSYSPRKYQVPLFQWIVAGIIMIIALCSFGFYTSSSSSRALLVAFYLVFAFAVTAYCLVFVGTNLDFFVKKISTTRSRQNCLQS